jgi:hypothetical protein
MSPNRTARATRIACGLRLVTTAIILGRARDNLDARLDKEDVKYFLGTELELKTPLRVRNGPPC